MRRAIAGALLLLAAVALPGIRWADSATKAAAVESAITPTPPHAMAIEAALTGRSDAATARWSDQRVVKARLRLVLAVLVGLSVLMAAGIVTLTRPSPAPRFTPSRRWSVGLRAPPLLRLA